MTLRNDWLNRTTKQFIQNTSPPDMLRRFGPPFDGKAGSNVDWIYDPDLSAVGSFPSIYWIVTGDVVTLMTPAQRAAVDQSIIDAQRTASANSIDDTNDLIRAVVQAVMDEMNAQAIKMAEITASVDSASNFNAFSVALQGIADYPQRTFAQWKSAIRNRMGS